MTVKHDSIKVMPDFCSSGIWDGKTGIMIDHEELGLSKKLEERFHHWVYRMYDDGYKKPAYSGLKKSAVKPVWEEGLALAREIKKLFPDSQVEYWGEKGNCKLKKVKI